MLQVRQLLQSAVLIVRFNTVVTDMTKFLKKLNLRTKAKRKKTMSYNTFAKFYDKLTENVEYKKRADYISSFFKTFQPLLAGVKRFSQNSNDSGKRKVRG